MIEIILREDVKRYETKPLFGFSYRQVLAGVCAIAAGVVLWIVLTGAGVPYEVVGLLIVLVGAIVGVCFMAKIQGMYGSKRLPYLLNYYKRSKTVFGQNSTFVSKHKQEKIYEPSTGEVLEQTKKVIKQYRRAAKQAASETEFYDGEKCISAKKRQRMNIE